MSAQETDTLAQKNGRNEGLSSASIDPDEVEKFSKLAAEWWDPKGNFKPLHQLYPVRVTYIRDLVIDHYGLKRKSGFEAHRALAGLKVIDIGCGGGLLTEPMTRLGGDVTGIDVSEKNIKTASVHAREQDLPTRYLFTSAEKLAQDEAATYDVVTSMEVIEHVADIEAFMEAAATLLKPGGIMLLATLNKTMKSYALAIVGAEFVLGWLPRGTHDWKKFLTPAELFKALEQQGLLVTQETGVTYNPLTDRWSLSHDMDVNYMMVATKPVENHDS